MKCLVPSKKSKHFGLPSDILKIIPNPVIFEITTTGASRQSVTISLWLLCQSSHHAFLEIDKKLKSYPS